NGVLCVLDPVLRSRAPLESPNGALERRRPFRRRRRGSLVSKNPRCSRPFQAAWFHPYGPIAHETLFHYYLWPWLHLFGYNILTNEAALLALWCTTFLFTLLLTDLFFQSYVVTSVIALVFTFLPFAFIYTFVGYHYEMAAPLCVASLYFLHVGFKTDSSFCLALGGIAAGLCLA